MDDKKTDQGSGGRNRGRLPVLLALVSVVLFLALAGSRFWDDISGKESIPAEEPEATLLEDEGAQIDDGIDDEILSEEVPEEPPSEAASTWIILWDGETAAHVYDLTAEVGDKIQLPGIPDALRHTDEVFSCYNSRKDLTGKEYYPGESITIRKEVTDLYLVWEPALIKNSDDRLIKTHTFVQSYEKTDWTPSIYTIQGGTLAERDGRRYWIQAMALSVAESETAARGVPEPGDYTALFIYDFDTGEVVNYSTSIPFGHGNDLEYNPYYDAIVICSAFMNDNTITLVDWDLQNYRSFIPGGCEWFRVASCAFDADQGLYYLTLTPDGVNSLSEGEYVMRYDQGWSWKGTIEEPFASPFSHYGFQGANVHNGYYYLANYLQFNQRLNGTRSYNCGRISVYDVYRFTYLGSIPVNVPDEIEDVTVIGRTAYLNGQIHRDPADKQLKFSVYEMDLGDLEFMLDITRSLPRPESMGAIKAALEESPGRSS